MFSCEKKTSLDKVKGCPNTQNYEKTTISGDNSMSSNHCLTVRKWNF